MTKFCKFLLFLINRLYPSKTYGKENITNGGAIIICNHLRWFDPAFVANCSKNNTFYLAKKELFKNRLIAKFITNQGAIPVDREKADIKSIKTSIDILKKGNKLVIFPEGTRNKQKNTVLQEIKGGTAYLSIKAQVPIIPFFIYNRSRLFRKTYVIVGTPFDFSEYYDTKVSAEKLAELDLVVKEKMLEQQKIITKIRESKK